MSAKTNSSGSLRLGRKGQGDFLSGDIPSIILIVVSIGFFISSVYLANQQFSAGKTRIDMEAALVDAASSFLKENAKIKPGDLSRDSEFWTLRMEKLVSSYQVEVYAELTALDESSPVCTRPREEGCSSGKPPPAGAESLSKRFPIALKVGATDLEVYPALMRVTVYKPS